MLISQEASEWIAKGGNEIWLFITRGGCTGLMYCWVRNEETRDVIAGLDHCITIYSDHASLPFLQDAVIRLKVSVMGCGLEIFNPKAEASCRCSKSFVMKGVSKQGLKDQLQSNC